MQMDRHPLSLITNLPTWLKLPKELAGKVGDFNQAAEALRADKVKVATQAEALSQADPVEVSPDDFAAVRRARITLAQTEIKLRRQMPELVAAIQTAAKEHQKPASDAVEKLKGDIRRKVEAIGYIDPADGWILSHPAVAEARRHSDDVRGFPNAIHNWIRPNSEGLQATEIELRDMLSRV